MDRHRIIPCTAVVACIISVFLVALGPGSVALAASAPASAGPLLPPSPSDTQPKDTLDRQTPRRTILGFLKEGREGDFPVAAMYLDLREIPESRRERTGAELAQKLAYAIAHRPALNLARVPDEAEGDPTTKPAGTFVVDTLFVGEDPTAIAVERVRFPDGVERWLIARSTVKAIPLIAAAYGPRPVGVPIPPSLTRPSVFGNEPWQWLGLAMALLLAYGLARAAAALGVVVGGYFARRTPTRADDALIESARRPARIVIASLLFRAFVDPLQLTTAVLDVFDHVTFTALVVGVAWLIVRALGVATLWLDEQVGREGTDQIRGRRMRTQAVLLHRVATVTITFVASAVVCIQFDLVRNVGVSLLASAGVVSVVVGLAAQKSLAAVIGGIQFSVAQPVRMGDQVVVEGEFGELEEINLTYAVVRLWDKRRLILPITYFLEKPFQNWTRTASDLVGTVFLRADYGVPVQAVRSELKRICAGDPLWDKEVCSLAVTDSDDASVTLRVLVSAANASALWDLRCGVREKLLAFVQTLDGGKHLARKRHVVESSS